MEMLEALGIEFKLLFIQLVGFLILLWMMKKFLFGRVMDMIKKRGDEIRSAYETNEKTREELVELKAEYEQKLQDARREAEAIVQQATDRAEKAGQEVIEKTRREADQIRERGLAQIEQEKKRVVSELRNEVVTLSVTIASRIIDKALDTAEAEKITDDAIQNMGETAQ
jgi:F-type H+-transporting ATPase subunit b